MKYLRFMILFSLIVILIGFLLVITESGKKPLSIEATAVSKPESIQENRFFRIYLDETETDHKIIISTNEDESVYKKGSIIVKVLDDEDYERLLNIGF